ncbi:MAG: hypothetical protein CMQ78_09000 [Gammaproteobacteria bacterium]|nr:hypothetical protein [Gammaproteobacteria bacterium]MAW57965.1 hypothetical protein [Gammaproteobacteria bacterium]
MTPLQSLLDRCLPGSIVARMTLILFVGILVATRFGLRTVSVRGLKMTYMAIRFMKMGSMCDHSEAFGFMKAFN